VGRSVTAQKLAPDILQNVTRLHHQDQEGDQQQHMILKAGNLQCDQGGNMRQAEHADHESPLDLCHASHEIFGISSGRDKDGKEQRHVDRNENRVQPRTTKKLAARAA
jgi:hypothetical protein